MPSIKRRIWWVLIGSIALWWVIIGGIANISFIFERLGPFSSSVLFALSAVAIIGFTLWIVDEDESVWNAITDNAHRIAAKVGLINSRVVVEGAIAHEGVVWVCERFRNGTSDFSHRACPSCQLELVERHIPVSALDTTVMTDGGETVDALSCPHCMYAIRGDNYELSGAHAALSRFKNIVDKMESGGQKGIEQWERIARSTIGTDSTPADVWDEYTKSIDDDSIRRRTAGPLESSDRRAINTYPAFAELKRTRDFRDQIVEWLPNPLDIAAAKGFRTDYLERKEALKQKRHRARIQYNQRRDQIQNEHQDTLTSLTKARTDRTWPDNHSEAKIDQIDDDIESLSTIQTRHDRFLTGAEHKNIDRISTQFENGLSYHKRAEKLRTELEDARTSTETFESEFEPYSEYDTYLGITAENRLRTLLSETNAKIKTIRKSAKSTSVPVPTDAVDQLDELETLASEWQTVLDEYESLFVDHEIDTYPDIFETDHGPLNEKQILAVVRNEPYNLVDASAGTGKTLTLTRRFLYLYEKGTSLDDIVAITFTSDAAEEMRTRVAEAAGHLDPQRLNIMTNHALAREICSRAMSGDIDHNKLENGTEIFLDRAFSIDSAFQHLAPEAMETFLQHRRALPETDKDDLTSHKIKDPKEGADKRIRDVFEAARNFNRTPEEIRERTDRGDLLEYHTVHAVAALLEVYAAVAADRDHPIDHDHSIERATELVNTYPDRYQGCFEHVLFDEFQDVSRRQLDFIKALFGSESHLFAVGDDWQSIYGFRGSKPAFFREFESRFGESSQTTLEINYRCPPSVVQAGTEVMLDSTEATTKRARAKSTLEKTPVLHRLWGPYTDRSNTYIADLIEDLVNDEGQYDDVMVLTRNNSTKDRIISRLQSREIPVKGPDTADEDSESVTVQTVHKAKGTEAPYVIVANAVDDQPGGMPRSKRQTRGKEPVLDETIDHYEEERRVFYVALTRAEKELHLVARFGAVSRYVDSITSLEVIDDRVTIIEGKVIELNRQTTGPQPHKIKVDCGSYDAHLLTWEDDFITQIEKDSIYRFDDLAYQPNGYDEDMEITEGSSIRRVQ